VKEWLWSLAMAEPMTDDKLLHFVCAKCDAHLTAHDAVASVKAPCPYCGEDITAPGKAKPIVPPGASSLEKVKKAVESKPVKLEPKPPTPKVPESAPFSVAAPKVIDPAAISKTEEELAEFSAMVKLLVLSILALIVAGVVGFYFQDQVSEFLNEQFGPEKQIEEQS